MNNIEKVKILSEKHKEIVLYPDVKTKVLFSGIGRVPGTFNKELIEFLKFTNGASIMDYCMLGFKNRQLGTDIDKFVLELWGSNDCLTGKVVGFMINSTGDTFGYLIGSEFETLSFKNPIVYNNEQAPNELYVIGTSFNKFMNTFLNDVEQTILSSSEDLLLGVELPNWPIDVEHWKKNDVDLLSLYEEIGISSDGVIKFK